MSLDLEDLAMYAYKGAGGLLLGAVAFVARASWNHNGKIKSLEQSRIDQVNQRNEDIRRIDDRFDRVEDKLDRVLELVSGRRT